MMSVAILAASIDVCAAVHPTRAQIAYFHEHDKCVAAFRQSAKKAKTAPADERKKEIAAAKQDYRQCEAHAHLVWKYYPAPPPLADNKQ